MAPPYLWMGLMVVAVATGAHSASEENELDYGFWNYREGADSVNVATVRSVTRVLDAWGKRIFNEIRTLLHSQPSTLLPDYSRVRPLSESLNDLFREVSLLRRRITELSHPQKRISGATRPPHTHSLGDKDQVKMPLIIQGIYRYKTQTHGRLISTTQSSSGCGSVRTQWKLRSTYIIRQPGG
uniref:Si:ch211-243a20.3 n=1 Tax=Labrus bergylta TaxID=56723 RepID=A0A3Q3E398_9LABR